MLRHPDDRTAGARPDSRWLAFVAITVLLSLGVCATQGSNPHGSAAVADAAEVADTIPAATLALGRQVYDGKVGGALCTTCHGTNGKGAPGLGPDLTDRTWLHGDGSREFLERIIRTGVPRPRTSGAIMPPFGGGSLGQREVHAVAAHVHSISH